MATLNIYIGAVEDFSQHSHLPDYAVKSLEKTKNKRSAEEKKAGYGLLDYALKQMNINSDVTECFLSETGKPLHKDFCFSVSHSSGVVAVAISSKPLGIDVELCDNEKRTERLKQKILHENETNENTLVLWTIKEAVFKFDGKEKVFIPSSIDTTEFNSKTFKFTWQGKNFILSVAADDLSEVNFHNTSDNIILPVEK